jgi:hypothetical protein
MVQIVNQPGVNRGKRWTLPACLDLLIHIIGEEALV